MRHQKLSIVSCLFFLIAANIEVVSNGNFSEFVNDGKVDVDKLIIALFKGGVYISTRLKQ